MQAILSPASSPHPNPQTHQTQSLCVRVCVWGGVMREKEISIFLKYQDTCQNSVNVCVFVCDRCKGAAGIVYFFEVFITAPTGTQSSCNDVQ